MAIIDRRGVSVSSVDPPIAGDPNPGLAIKAPCLVATTGNITLAGVQTIDGIAVGNNNERVLVWQQTDQTTNGLYNANSGNWIRTVDAATNDQWTDGMQLVVAQGSTYAGGAFQVASSDPITLGASRIVFATGASGMPLANVAALRALAPGAHTSVQILGYYAAGDGGGGVFVWSAVSTGSDNGGTIIQPTGGGVGRWLRQLPFLTVATPRMFGARGDGTDDKAFVQAAMDALAVNGGTLYFDSIYTVGATNTLHANGFSVIDWKSGVNLDGPGGLQLSANVNVATSVFTATFSGTTMTVTAISSGGIFANQFLTGNGMQPVTEVVTQLGGTPNGVGTYQTTTTNALGATAVKGTKRMAELIGNYNPASMTNTSCKNITLDYNGVNNCAGGTIWSFNSIVTVQTGSKVTFRGVSLLNNCGSNSIVLGYNQAVPTVTSALIEACYFGNNGDAVNPAAVDYSIIFAVCNNLIIVGNETAIGPSINGTAFEVYGQNIDIIGNSVSGCYNGANICAVLGQTTRNVDYVGNTHQDCSVGVTLWATTSTSKLYGINVSSNTFSANVSAPGGPYLVDAFGQVNVAADLRNILIEGNIFENFQFADVTRTHAGIALQSFYSAVISKNIIYGVGGPGIYITNALIGASLDITGNSLINTGYCTTSALKTGISLDAAATVSTLNISGNSVNPLGVYTLTNGINNALSATVGYIKDNLILSAATPIANTGAGVVVVTSPGVSGTLALLASPALTGIPTAPTAAVDTSTTQLATTAMVLAQAAAATPLVPSGAGAVGVSTRFARADHVHPAANTNTPILFSAGNNIALATGTWFFTQGYGASTESVVAIPMPVAGTIKNMVVSTATAPGGATTHTATVSKNGSIAGSPPSVTLTGAATAGIDVTHTLAVVAQDLISIKLVVSAGANTAVGFNVGLEFVTTSP